MVTHSEIVTDILARKIFFPRYTFSNVKYNVDKNENELCDCILEFNDYYIFIQVKEKNDLISDNLWDKKPDFLGFFIPIPFLYTISNKNGIKKFKKEIAK